MICPVTNNNKQHESHKQRNNSQDIKSNVKNLSFINDQYNKVNNSFNLGEVYKTIFKQNKYDKLEINEIKKKFQEIVNTKD
jgi:hypothetical protein